jgi:hypothetical protein
LKLVYTGVLKGRDHSSNWHTQISQEGSVQSTTGPIRGKMSFDMSRLDRRIAVAPMMDWIDEEEIAC